VANDTKKLKVTLVKGLASTRHDHRATVRGLGLTRRMQTVEVIDTPQTRGMIGKVGYLIKVTGA
jgi:large subunit ribosomal protein L30